MGTPRKTKPVFDPHYRCKVTTLSLPRDLSEKLVLDIHEAQQAELERIRYFTSNSGEYDHLRVTE